MKKMMIVLLTAAALLMGMNTLADTWTTRDEASFGRHACQADYGHQNCGAERCGEEYGWNGSCLNNSVCQNGHHRNHCTNVGCRRGWGR